MLLGQAWNVLGGYGGQFSFGHAVFFGTGGDVMAVLQKFSKVRPHPEAFVEALEPLQPRLYSISSSHNATPGKLSLTVDCVRYVINKRRRLGLASTFLAERIAPGDEVTLDANHPLAGVDLAFEVEITAVRPATPEELAHGHAHGADGAGHCQ